MTPIVAQTHTQPTPPVTQSTVAEIAVRSVSGATIAANAIASNPSAQSTVNNRQHHAPIADKTRTTQDVATLGTRATPNALSEQPASSTPSTPFLAQLLAQSPAESTSAIAQSFTSIETTHTLDPELLSGFSEVRYGPSYAAKPQPEPQRVVVTQESQAPAPRTDVVYDIPEQPDVSESAAPVHSQLSRYEAEPPRENEPVTFIS